MPHKKAKPIKKRQMSKRIIPSSELIINDDGTVFHLHLKPEQIADTVILVGDPARVELIASRFDERECLSLIHI